MPSPRLEVGQHSSIARAINMDRLLPIVVQNGPVGGGSTAPEARPAARSESGAGPRNEQARLK